jgi:hypothetical protein
VLNTLPVTNGKKKPNPIKTSNATFKTLSMSDLFMQKCPLSLLLICSYIETARTFEIVAHLFRTSKHFLTFYFEFPTI